MKERRRAGSFGPWEERGSDIETFLVAMRLRETPVPIPNTMVKTQTADGTLLETARESRWLPDLFGDVAQLGEHLPCKQGVMSSNLTISTRYGNIPQAH